MAAAGIHRGQVGGRENCTLRRFRIRGLIEGMLRTVMGNICQGQSQNTGGQWCDKVTGKRSPGGQRKANQENIGRNWGYGGNRNRTCECKVKKWEGKGRTKGNKVQERKDKKSTAEQQTVGLEYRWKGWCAGMLYLNTNGGTEIKFFKYLLVSYHQRSHVHDKDHPRPPDCSRAEVCASLATKSRAVQLPYTSRLTVANCPTQGCTIRRFCWDDQHDKIQV